MDTHGSFFTGRIGFYGRLLRVLLLLYGHGLVLRVSIGSYTGMEYSLFFYVF
jgi:hypothetical protein